MPFEKGSAGRNIYMVKIILNPRHMDQLQNTEYVPLIRCKTKMGVNKNIAYASNKKNNWTSAIE